MLPWELSFLRLCNAVIAHSAHSHSLYDLGPTFSVLSHCLVVVGDWRQVNQLKLNPDKTGVMVVGRPFDVGRKGEMGHLSLMGVQPLLVTQVCSLCMLRDPLKHLDLQGQQWLEVLFTHSIW